MCLDTITSVIRGRKREGYGWKVFRILGGILYSEYYYRGRLVLRKEGVWLKSKDDKSESYPLGFHVFKTRREARMWKTPGQCIRKVIWRDFLAEGIQYYFSVGLRTIIAKEIMIL